jgi:hypothetical protein
MHKLVAEALYSILWNAYRKELDPVADESVKVVCTSFICSHFSEDLFHELQRLPEFKALRDEFINYFSGLRNPVAKSWMSYISMVNVLLDFI